LQTRRESALRERAKLGSQIRANAKWLSTTFFLEDRATISKNFLEDHGSLSKKFSGKKESRFQIFKA
jgi:hypothetical protein